MSDPDYPYDLGGVHRAVTTSEPAAQLWFDRGLSWCWGFNHEEAARCFQRAVQHDPSCAMAHWGLAYALGPNYNRPWGAFGEGERGDVVRRTHEAVAAAAAASPSATDVEKALVQALRSRYPRSHDDPAVAQDDREREWSIWNVEYADAMAAVATAHPDDPDVAALYADAMMNLTPWQLWDLKSGQPASGRARTLEIKRVLDHALALEEGFTHPGLLHLYIHLMEMSPTPEAALPAANRLRNRMPGSGHLRHMPSHIDVLVGDYAAAVEANGRAMEADEVFLAREGARNFYTLYRSHDYHFRLYAAMFSGQSAVALETVARLEASISEDLLRVEAPPLADWLEAFFAMRVHALVRFGRWRDILDRLALPADPDLYCVTTSLTHYAKTIAHAALGDPDAAHAQRALFRESLPRVKPTRHLFNNTCRDILGVASALLDGEVEFRSGNHDAAFEHLREAVRRSDAMPYDEPWGWMQPPRHALGALLLEHGRPEDALPVYAADLGFDGLLPRPHRHPNNVWSLHGYHESLVRLGRHAEAEAVKPQLDAAVKVADIPIRSSCFCRRTADA